MFLNLPFRWNSYFASIRFPDWAEGRREEIIGRIKSAFPEPDYEYDER